MDSIHLFFEQNQPIIRFAYGLAFFIMGLAIALQSRQFSRLELARSLAWLAAFGITNSLYEWGELFSPVHEVYLSPRGIILLHDVHLLLLSISFMCLLEFGVALLRPLRRSQWLHPVTNILFGSYVVFILFILPMFITDPHVWHNSAEALARYLLGFAGGILAAYGLREQAYRYIAPLKAPHIVATLRIAGVALALYAVLGGLIPPPIFFFPGSLVNTESFEQVIGLPTIVFQSLIGLTLSITIIRALEVFQVETERRIEQMEQQQILAAERERMARELHDRTIQTAYTASLLVDSARKIAEPESQIHTRLDHAVKALEEVIQDLRRNLGELRSPPTGESLSVILRQMAEDPRFRSLVDIDLDLKLSQAESISPARSDQVIAIIGEALSNVIRHAHATQVSIQAQQVDGRLDLIIRDNGSGLPSKVIPGFGMRNMSERARLLGGQLSVTSDRGRGTTLHLDIPWQEDQ